ncbi:hypothetical protein DPMN_062640 [Dreissena polymorpha]|jgi:hypothetical protein|uniref:Uncharacterized protein n=1 Tax=Dreissena polymorpha TaxID=45954 RepID=A0A9D4C929_DREPO|nr:hypothetical protein DPMN_062640 [Dreissena polymorpha]
MWSESRNVVPFAFESHFHWSQVKVAGIAGPVDSYTGWGNKGSGEWISVVLTRFLVGHVGEGI